MRKYYQEIEKQNGFFAAMKKWFALSKRNIRNFQAWCLYLSLRKQSDHEAWEGNSQRKNKNENLYVIDFIPQTTHILTFVADWICSHSQ
jgi:hypothetical protein